MTNGTNGDDVQGGDGGGTAATIFLETERLFSPVGLAAERAAQGDTTDLVLLLEEMGLGEQLLGEEVSVLEEKLVGLAEPYPILRDTIQGVIEEDRPPEPDEIVDLVESISGVVSTVQELSSLSLDVDALDTVPKIVIDYLVVRYLRLYRPKVLPVLVLTGVVENATNDERERLNLAEIPKIIESPNRLASETLGWGTEEFEALEIVVQLDRFLSAFGIPSRVQWGETVSHYGSTKRGRELDVPLLVTGLNELPTESSGGPQSPLAGNLSTGLRLLPAPGDADNPPGLALDPYGELTMNKSFDLSRKFVLNTKADIDALTWGIAMRPSGSGVAAEFVAHEGDPLPELHGEANLEYRTNAGEEEPSPLLGDPEGTRLDLLTFGIETAVDASADDFELRAAAPTKARLIVQPSGGFVADFIPEGIRSEFGATIGYSTKSGLYFQGEGSIEAAIALEKELGPITLKEIYLALGFDTETGEIPITVAASAAGSLGPLDVTVKRIGVEATLSFVDDGSGKAGPLDFDVGFKPPSGLGVNVGAGPVTGGGYIEHEPDKHRYSGTLQLEIGDYTIKAVGLLKTKLPSGEDGFSFLLLITAELPPIDIGFGFTLNGVGGLLGMHRGMRKDPLAKAVRTGNMGSVLFPENVVANAQRIISDLRSIFPPKVDRHVVGPMARFGWGKPTLLTMDIGIVLAIPTWKIALLGKIGLVLPDEDAAVVDLNLAVLGFLDIPNKRLEMTASLYDSRIAMFSVKGDMALKSSWGDDASFILSMGGFHSRYEPPKSFPELDRLQAWIPDTGGVLRVRMSGYLAVTPNTFQVGAGVLVHAEAGPAKVHGELSFDALFQFNPFKFIFDFYAKFAVELWGHGLSIEISGRLQGPKPLQIQGKVKINLPLLPTVKASLDVSIGSKPGGEELPESKVFDKLVAELETPQNWQAQLPEDGAGYVTVRQSQEEEDSGDGDGGNGDAEKVLTHPLGGLGVRQTVVPLEYRIEKFGNTRPAGFEKFRVTSVKTVDDDGTTEIGPGDDGPREKFAPAKYRKKSDSEKLSSKAFDERLAGHRSGGDQFHGPTEKHCTTASLRYETLVTDERERNFTTVLTELGGYREFHPDVARLGLLPETSSAALQLSAVGRTRPKSRSFLVDRPIRVGLPDIDTEDSDEDDTGVVVSEVVR